jgi:hypothetical protein
MDNITHDNLGVEDVTKILDIGKNAVQKLKDKKFAKQANEFVAKGKYWNLSQYSKSLIPIPAKIISETSGKGITEQAILNLPPQKQKAPYPGTTPEIIAALQLASGMTVPGVGTTAKAVETAAKTAIATEAKEPGNAQEQIKKYLPYVLGAAVIGLIVYLISKK